MSEQTCDHCYGVQSDGTEVRCSKSVDHKRKGDPVHEAQVGKVTYRWR